MALEGAALNDATGATSGTLAARQARKLKAEALEICEKSKEPMPGHHIKRQSALREPLPG